MADLDKLYDDTPILADVFTNAPGAEGSLPLTEDMLLNSPSGDLFALSQNVGMGWDPAEINRTQVLILSTQGGIRADDGTPIALGYHTGHWEVGLLMQAAAKELRGRDSMPFAGYVTDPCDGRSQGTEGMLDSLPYRNDAAQVFRRLIRSLPTRHAVMGVATCDKGLPAMLMALAGTPNLPTILVPGGVTLPPTHGEDAGKIQTIGARFAQGEISLKEASELGCRACATSGGGCQFLGTAATSQVVAEALGMALPHAALAPSGQPIWLELARASARALLNLKSRTRPRPRFPRPAVSPTPAPSPGPSGGSPNRRRPPPAAAPPPELERPSVADWNQTNKRVPRVFNWKHARKNSIHMS